MRYRLNKADCIEMRECYEFYETTDTPMFYRDLAFMFDCSKVEVRECMDGIHPELLDKPKIKKTKIVAAPTVKRPVGRPRKHVL